MTRRFHYSVCALAFDNHNKKNKPCYGALELVEGLALCERHRKLVEAIKTDANKQKRRHPNTRRAIA